MAYHREHADLEDPADVDLIDVLEALGIPVEAALAASITTLAGLGYLLRRLDNNE